MDLIENTFAFLNENSGTINLFFSLVVALSTVVYAWLTAKLVNETRVLRKAQTEPLIAVSYQLREDILGIIGLKIENVGSGPAYNIEFNISGISNNKITEEVITDLRNISLLRKTSYIAPGQVLTTRLINIYKYKEFDFDIKIKIEACYKSSLGVTYYKNNIIDLSELEGFSVHGEPLIMKISKELKIISNNLGNIYYVLSFFKNRDYFYEVDQDSSEWGRHIERAG